MDPCGIHSERNINAVVNEKLSVITLAKYSNFFGEIEECFTVQILFAQLDGFDTAVQRLFDDCADIAPLGECPIADEIQVKIRLRHCAS